MNFRSHLLQAIAILPALPLLVILGGRLASAQPSTAANEWTWVGGTNALNCTASNGTTTCEAPGTYGTLGVPSTKNLPGGRTTAAAWMDAQGNLWLFGGFGYDSAGISGYLNDLWEYSPGAKTWTWKSGSSAIAKTCQTLVGTTYCGPPGTYGTKGQPSSANSPGGRWEAAAWSDSSGHLWLFGGYGFDASGVFGQLNDLWEYDLSAGTWTWVGGANTLPCLFCGQAGVYGTLRSPAASNWPGGRYSSTTWTDSKGNFWLMGGSGTDSHSVQDYLDDLWEFDPSSGEWTWMSGDDVGGGPGWGIGGVYGTLRSPSTGNKPGSRTRGTSWVDSIGDLWLFGGYGFDSSTNEGLLNDMWEFSPSTNEWTWMGGGDSVGEGGIYGVLGVGTPSDIPGQRWNGNGWTDSIGDLWLFAGWGSATTGLTDLNDLWNFNVTTDQWTWMGGDSSFGADLWYSGVYGSPDKPGIGGIPGSRSGAMSWKDQTGNFWLFGGGGYDSNGVLGGLNDLWEYQPAATALPPAITPTFNPLPGSYPTNQSVTIGNGMTNAQIYYTTDGTTPTSGSALYSSAITVSSKETIQAIAIASGYPNSAIASGTFEIQPQAAPPQYSLSGGPSNTYTTPQEVTLTDSTPGAVIYWALGAVTPGVDSTVYTGPITVSTPETISAIAMATGYSNSNVSTRQYNVVVPSAATPNFSVPGGTYTSAQSVTISDSTPNATIFYTTDGTTPTTSSSQYSAPISVSQTEAIQAIATAPGYPTSAVASATYIINLPPPNFSLSSGASALTINSGGNGNLTLTVTPQNGFNSAVSFACSGLPSGATCSFNPSSVTPSGSAVTSTLTIAASASASVTRPAPGPFLPAAGLALAGCLLAFSRSRALRLWLLPLAAIAVLGALSACGGGGTGGGSSGGGSTTSTVTLTATSGSLQQSTTITLTVN